MTRLLPSALALLLITLHMDAQTLLPLKRITIFKNGTCLMTREGKVPIKDGVARLPIPTDALFGGYWLGAVNNSLEVLTFKTDTLEKSNDSKELADFLLGNVGKKMRLAFHAKEQPPITGQLISCDSETGLLRIRQENGTTSLLLLSSLHQVDFLEEMVTTYTKDTLQRMVVIKPGKPGRDLQLQQLSMQAGINWVPSYLLKIRDDKTARLEMKAVIENGVEDLINGETELVVGAPQMYFGQRRDPITYDYLTEGSHAGDAGGMPTQMLSNSLRSREMLASPSESAFDNEYGSDGEKTGDLYIYQIGKINLPKGSKASYSVFAAPVEYAHKYEAVIPDHTNFINNRYIQPGETPLDVIHSLTLKNTASVPLTTAPVMVVTEKEQFLAQDLLRYTAMGGQVDIKLSKALDISVSHAEEEIERKDEAKKTGGYTYGRVLIRGSVTLSNRQKKEATVSVKKTVTGHVTKTDGGKATKERIGTDNNPVTVMAWEVKLPATGAKTLVYEYEVFFRQ